ncbi:DUF5330 domain-containing protein [Xanthobacter sp. TB0136]|uniref:DUF5330 domain-containing protein n=1 Tax=Xanthobacter sp. TB0136 TaxID=3459177 RepID=UPI004039A581
MFFLLRMTFWIALLLLLLPLGLKGTTGQDVSVFDAFGAVQAVVADASGFCERQPQACAIGGQMVSHLTEKAQAGAQWIAEALSSQNGTPAASAEGTGLKADDLSPVWGGGEKAQPVGPAPHAGPDGAQRPS